MLKDQADLMTETELDAELGNGDKVREDYCITVLKVIYCILLAYFI